MLWMGVVAAVLRSRFVREDLVVGHIVEIQIVACWTANDWWVHAKIADERSHRDVHYIVAKTATIRPTPGNNAIAKARLNLADQSVVAENAQPRKSRVIRVGTLLSPIAGQATGICRQINFDQIGNKDPCDVSAACLDVGQLTIEDDLVDQSCQFGSYRILAKQVVIGLRTGAAVAILIGDSNQALVEERIALPGDLHPGAVQLRVTVSSRTIGLIAQYCYLTAAGGCVNADHLLVTAQFAYRDDKAHHVNVESAL